MLKDLLPATSERVRNNTNPRINEKIRLKTIADSTSYANKSREEITTRIQELHREWDTERSLETHAALVVLISVTLGYFWSPYWYILAVIIGIFLLQHALQGWCPPLPIIRHLGYRTAEEINEEETALKILRGDFDHLGRDTRRFVERHMR